VSISTEHPDRFPFLFLRHLRASGMNTIKTGDADGFKVTSAIPQDILLIHNLVGVDLPETQASTAGTNDPSVTLTAKAEEDDADSITSSAGEDEAGDIDMLKAEESAKEKEVGKGADSEEEVEAGLLDGDADGEPMTM
jgi:hypothetical protein